MGDTTTRQAAQKETDDIAFAAYAHMKGLKIISAKEYRQGNRVMEFKFMFEDPPTTDHPNGQWNQLHIDWTNSEARAFDASIWSLKKLCRQNSHSGR